LSVRAIMRLMLSTAALENWSSTVPSHCANTFF
jgi:hypothetical protein